MSRFSVIPGILDASAMEAISPAALAAYARRLGWRKMEPYGDTSDVYVHDAKPEILIPRTQRLADYARVVAALIEAFADETGHDVLSVHRMLAATDPEQASAVLRSGVRLHGFVNRLKRSEEERTGTIGLRTIVDGRYRSVQVVLPQADYERAVEGHKARAIVEMRGDLEQFGQRWRLLNPRLTDVIRSDEADDPADAA